MKKAIIALILCGTLLLTGCVVKGNKNTSTDSAEDSTFAESKEETSSIYFAESSDAEKSQEESTYQTSEEISTEADTDALKALADFKASVTDVNKTLAIAYVGFCDGDFDAVCRYLEELGVYNELPFLKLITEDGFASLQGSQLYVAIPLSEGSRVWVSEYLVDPDNYLESVGEEILRGEVDMPVLFRGNYSDVFSNLHVGVGNESYVEEEYRPFLSFKDGKLNVDENNIGVYDFTPYALLGIKLTDWVGEWYAEHQYDEETKIALLLSLDDFGGVSYSLGYVLSEVETTYTGTWSESDGKLTINLTDNSDPDGEPITAVLEWKLDGSNLLLTHVDGVSLVSGFENETFNFEPDTMVG